MSYIWYFVIGFTVFFFLLFLLIGDKSKIENYLFMFFLGAPFIGFVAGVMCFFFASVIMTDHLPKKQVIMDSYDLVALNQDKQTEGKISMFFFVGSGYIGETEYYCYYKQFGNGDIKFEKVEATDVFLNQQSDTPRVVRYGWKYDSDSKWLMNDKREEIRYTKTVLYIPEGTIKRNFKIN